MIFVVEDSNFANITFNGGAKVTSLSESTYLVRWFLDGNFIGEMDIAPGCWASFPLEVGNWKVEFWREDQLVNTYDNNLQSNYILFAAKFPDNTPGKSIDIKKLEERIESIRTKYECKIVCYFSNSERYNLPETIIPFRLNDQYEFKLMIEEWIA